MKRKAMISLCLCLCMQFSGHAQDYDASKLKQRVDVYMNKVAVQSDWLTSRLQMYWHSHATDVYVNGETFDHAGGNRAPVPTVRFNGTRSNGAAYSRPKLEDIVPYDDDAQSNVTYINKATGIKEKVSPAKTGCNIAGVNREILGIARDAARIFAATGDTAYANLARPVLDTYLKGIYHRNVPTDLMHGHMQTLVGMTTFEVIHEDAVNEVTETYRLLVPRYGRSDLHEAAMKKWAENIIANGVPHNNWNLFQAEFVAKIASALQPNSAYSDGKGREYYQDRVLNKSSIRQWSMKRMTDYCFDHNTAIWYESPGYSTTVLNDFASFANRMDVEAGMDMFKDLPVLKRAVMASPQYLMPNRMICGFGDTHPNYLSMRAADQVLDYARRHGDKALEQEFVGLKEAIASDAPKEKIEQYVSPSFYAPNVSWLMQRTGMDERHDLAISLNGSLGNHMHANGISMELYGKGFVLGPDGGIGRTLYSGDDYKEYYSQFPAHNTVCVNGKSGYAVMMSNHAFKVEARYPDTNDKVGFGPATFSQVSFVEPETQARQMRTNGIVRTSDAGGYYIDIFRSRAVGDGQFHDYFYHNLGQTMTLTGADNGDLALKPSEELAFAGGNLYAYSYIYDKKSARTGNDVKATFTTECPDGRKIDMTMWMQGYRDREVFKALSPVNLEYERLPKFMPYNVGEQPVLTYVARQCGEAWTKPFVAVFEPSVTDEPSEIRTVEFFKPSGKDAVGIKVVLKNGRTDYIFSAPQKTKMKYDGMKVDAVYSIISNGKTILCR